MRENPTSPWRFGPKPVIGLLGAPGSGKSSVARLFAQAGGAVIDADRLSHDVLESPAARGRVVAWWGDQVLDEAGKVDRKAVGSIVFNAPGELERLEALVHPLVHKGRAELRARYMADDAVTAIVEDCPLLLETGLDKQCDRLVYVDCPEPVRLQRLQATRGWDASEAKKREQHQLPLDTKSRSADYVIDNGQLIENVRIQVNALMQQFQDTRR